MKYMKYMVASLSLVTAASVNAEVEKIECDLLYTKEAAIEEMKQMARRLVAGWSNARNDWRYEKYQKTMAKVFECPHGCCFRTACAYLAAEKLANEISMHFSGKGLSKEALKYRFDADVLGEFDSELRKLILKEIARNCGLCCHEPFISKEYLEEYLNS